jgi:hypothetical protein
MHDHDQQLACWISTGGCRRVSPSTLAKSSTARSSTVRPRSARAVDPRESSTTGRVHGRYDHADASCRASARPSDITGLATALERLRQSTGHVRFAAMFEPGCDPLRMCPSGNIAPAIKSSPVPISETETPCRRRGWRSSRHRRRRQDFQSEAPRFDGGHRRRDQSDGRRRPPSGQRRDAEAIARARARPPKLAPPTRPDEDQIDCRSSSPSAIIPHGDQPGQMTRSDPPRCLHLPMQKLTILVRSRSVTFRSCPESRHRMGNS